ncbi:DUF5985 family protein [Caulobacter sp. 17J80-11]|uniref:DUF5985 family protein n=1 Tax=Caulobacter sp. 17J80-11 TaxID=2763502 RepID=UPI001653CDCB|nr:DUF5985 family protein [Caulobacter sp. 17J80-11]MBC6983533.1 hypothetical protein [Caulobacter sp. 17J80-11]
MQAPETAGFIAGLVTMGYTTAGLFFLRFWTRTRDRFFLSFAAAFWLMALNGALIIWMHVPKEEQSWIYLLRLAAFVLIIGAVLGKNLGGKRAP